MTSTELQQVVKIVLGELQENSVSISQLEMADDLQGTECVELDNGKKCSVSKIADLMADWTGTQEDYNALGAWDAGRWYLIVEDGAVVALWRGDRLVWAKPNCVGQFATDSMPADWKWWPDGVETALPVDPATLRFAFYYPKKINGTIRFYNSSDPISSKLVGLGKLPTAMANGLDLDYLPQCESYPVIDCRNFTSLLYFMIGRTNFPNRLHFANTQNIRSVEMVFNVQKGQLKIFTGFDCASLERASNWPFGSNGAAYMELKNLGMAKNAESFDLRDNNWGNETIVTGARQSVVDTLLTHSFDRVAAGYGPVTVQLSSYTYSVLTADEIAAITAKGFTLTQE